MDSFAELITNRRSIRKFTDEILQPQEVEQIMKAALMAPTSKNGRPWHFVLVEDKQMLKNLSVCKSSGASFLEGAALAIIVLTDPLLTTAPVEDSSIAATYIQLQAEDLGLGSCWIQIAGRETEDGRDSEQVVRDLLDIPYQLQVGCIVALGHKIRSGKPHSEEDLLWERLHIDKFTYGATEE